MLNDCYLFKKVMREVTPLTANDCFTISSRKRTAFNFPLHTHHEMELTLILGAGGAQRIVGDHFGESTDAELVMVGSDLPHGWFTNNAPVGDIREITILFDKELFSQQFLNTDTLRLVKKLFDNARLGILFPPEVVQEVSARMIALSEMSGFEALLQFLSLLHTLSVAKDSVLLSEPSFSKEQVQYDSRRLERAFEHMNRHFGSPVTLGEIAKIAHMSEASFSRFIKANTGYTFTEKLTEIRLGHVSRMLVSSQQTIAEIAYQCGFNNMANFNKLFKRRKGCTPRAFRVGFNRQGG